MAIRVSINNQNRTTIRTVGIAPKSTGVDNLRELKDVDASDPNTNETLVYDEVTGKYIVKTLPIVNGGTF